MKLITALLLCTLSGAPLIAAIPLAEGEHTLTTKTTYLLAVSEDSQEASFTLTTLNTDLNAGLQITAAAGKTVHLTLDSFRIFHDKPIVVEGSGTVIFSSTGSGSALMHTGAKAGATISAPEATLRFDNDKTLLLRLKDNTAASAVNVVPIRAHTVLITRGNLDCRALASTEYAENYPLTPAIDATVVSLSGETTKLDLTFYAGDTVLKRITGSATLSPGEIEPLQLSPIKCGTFRFTGGTLSRVAPVYPAEKAIFTKTYRYHYPDAAYDTLLLQSAAGSLTTSTQKIFHFPDWTPESGTDYSACFKDAAAEDVSVDTEKKTLTVNQTQPEWVYTEGSVPDAVTLFGATPVPTPEGLQISYAFGIDRLTSDGSAVFARVAVDLPKVTEETATFHLKIFEAGTAEPVYSGNPVFTREAADSIRFVTDPISVLTGLARSASVTRAYTVTAREATTE